MTKIKKIIIIILILFAVFFTTTELFIMKYLTKYGYGIKKLPQTTLVYFHMSNGFTVDSDEKRNVFIGRSDYIYDKVFEKKGYYEADGMGLDIFYNKKGEVKENNHTFDLHLGLTDDWCHWFRIYTISQSYTIEDF